MLQNNLQCKAVEAYFLVLFILDEFECPAECLGNLISGYTSETSRGLEPCYIHMPMSLNPFGRICISMDALVESLLTSVN